MPITPTVPMFLRKIQRKHIVMMKMYAKNKAFANKYKAELSSLKPASADSCWSCGEGTGALLSIKHVEESGCLCKIHEECMTKWMQIHEKKGTRIRVCPACRCKREGWQPKKYPAPKCHAVTKTGCCTLPLGHLGNCQ